MIGAFKLRVFPEAQQTQVFSIIVKIVRKNIIKIFGQVMYPRNSDQMPRGHRSQGWPFVCQNPKVTQLQLQVEILSVCTSSLQNLLSMTFKSSQNCVRPHILYTIGKRMTSQMTMTVTNTHTQRQIQRQTKMLETLIT